MKTLIPFAVCALFATNAMAAERAQPLVIELTQVS